MRQASKAERERDFRARMRQLAWWQTYCFWTNTKASLTSWKAWLAYLGIPLLLYALIGVLLFFTPQPNSHKTVVDAYLGWAGLFGFFYFMAGAFWVVDGVRCLSWDVADQIADDNFAVRAPVLLAALTALIYGLWSLAWWVAASEFAPACSPERLSRDVQYAVLFRDIGGCFVTWGTPSLRGTLIFAGALTVVIVAVRFAEELYEGGKFAWLFKRSGHVDRSGGGLSLSTTLDAVGGAVTDIGQTIGRLVGFVKGGLWCLLAAFVIWVVWVPQDLVTWIVFGLGVVAGGKGLSEIGPALTSGSARQTGPRLAETQARTATEDEARQAARGDGRDATVDSLRYPD